jgi:hypothetical protein
MSEANHEGQREALKRTAVALKKSGLLFALGGGYAAWARGGPEPAHDVDFIVADADAQDAEQVLTDAGLRVEHPPEDWLFKVFTDDAMVDVIFRVGGDLVGAELLGGSGADLAGGVARRVVGPMTDARALRVRDELMPGRTTSDHVGLDHADARAAGDAHDVSTRRVFPC